MFNSTDDALTPQPLPEETITHDGWIILGIAPPLTLLSTICVIMRMLSRRMASSLQIDDWISLASLVPAYIAMITCMMSVTVGRGGYHVVQYSKSQLESWVRLNAIFNITYHLSITLTKISILLFYRRLFRLHQGVLTLIHTLISLVICYVGISVVGNSFGLARWREPSLEKDVKVIRALEYAMSILNAILEILVLIIPQHITWKMRLTRNKKLLVSGVFIIGGIACALGIVRAVFVTTVSPMDLTNTTLLPITLSEAEINVGIICSCLPMFPHLLRHWIEKFRKRNRHTPSSYGASSLTVGRAPVRRFLGEAGVQDSTEALNLESSTVGYPDSHSMKEMKSPRVHNQTPENSDTTLTARD